MADNQNDTVLVAVNKLKERFGISKIRGDRINWDELVFKTIDENDIGLDVIIVLP